jgi:hypothetical protein
MNTNLFNKLVIIAASMTFCSLIQSVPAQAASFSFSTGITDGKMATGARLPSAGKTEIKSADDFTLTSQTDIQQATFTGLLTNGAKISDITQVTTGVWHIFPIDSDPTRTITVPTRTNSPSDVAFAKRTSTANDLTFSVALLDPNFTALNSVLNGINPIPNQRTGGDGAVTGQEVQVTVNYSNPFSLAADHYFFVPQLAVNNGDFLWLSAPKTVAAPVDLQSWIKNTALSPDWERVGADIVGGAPAPAFNSAFSLSGQTTAAVPEPSEILGTLFGGASIVMLKRKFKFTRSSK